ncbi:hypothetical protein IFM62136_03392 [Aspergillus lentulus]|nr:hypothetical protein IFM62136_03392 [Aspergillus lentulus]
MGTRVMPNASPGDHPADGSTASSHVALGDPASFLGIQFGSDLAVLPHEHPSILHPWLPCGSNHPSPSSLSPAPNYLEYYQYHTPQLLNHQDAWNPLQVTGVPLNTSAFHLQPIGKPYQTNDYIERRCSTGQYSNPSENDSQYNGLASGDSGYGSRSCTTRSIAASSFAVDSACSPHLGPHEYELDDRTSTFDLGPSAYGEVAEKTEQRNAPCDYEIKCDYPDCNWKGKCPSDKRKHEARHRKLYKCDQPNCGRKQGFGTINDLARHKKCVHKQEPERGPKILYLCFGRNCPRRHKRWPRLDNFRQHLLRMHGDEDADELLKRSHEWYNSITQASELTLAAIDPVFEKDQSPDVQLPTEEDCVMEDLSQPPCISDVADETLTGARSPENEDRFLNPIKDAREQERDQEPVDAALMATSDTVHLPSFDSPDLASALDQKPPIHQNSKKSEYVEEFIADAATNMINALTKMMNSNHRRRSQQGNDVDDLTSHSTELCSPKKEILQRILTAALDCLSEKPEPSGDSTSKVPEREPDKKDWIQCGVCAKRTRLRCEMKKHQKRHERPYGCTFPKCSKTFGSKADWKRHENSQHYHIQSWYCTLCDPTKGKRYVRWYYRQEVFVQHLKTHHQVDNEAVRVAVASNRVGENGQSRFWCGFCREIIPLHSQGREAWNERFDHIDFEHFRRGQRIGDWVHCCHLNEDREHEESKGRNMAGGNENESPFATDDHSENENDCCSDCSSDTVLEEDGVALAQETLQQMVSCEKNSPSKRTLKLEDASKPGQSRKRKLDAFGPRVDPYQPHADGGSKAKRKTRAGIPLPHAGSSQVARHAKFDN